MGGEISTIQSLKAVDAWIDVINANINGGVRTAFKSSRLKFAGSNVDVSRAGSSTSLPLQFPEPGLTTANSVIDFSQGAITASTENTHLAIQGDGFYLVGSPDMVNNVAGSAALGTLVPSANAKMYLTRDGEFRTNENGLVVTSYGYFLLSIGSGAYAGGALFPRYDLTADNGFTGPMRAVFNNVDSPAGPAGFGPVLLSDFLGYPALFNSKTAGGAAGSSETSLYSVANMQNLRYSQFGSTVYDFGFKVQTVSSTPGGVDPAISLTYTFNTAKAATILSKSLEASNASMTQSVPELSLAQKLFSALTKVLQTKQTNVDGVLNLVR